ncbi:unnamed protein product [Penicillium pancosmium]
MGIPKTPPAQDDTSEPTSPKLPDKSTKSSVTTRSRKAKKPEEDDLPYHPPGRKGKRRAVDENPATESKSTPADSTEAVDVSPPPKKRAKTRAKKAQATDGAEKKGKALVLGETPDSEAAGSTDPAVDVSPLPKKVAKTRAEEVKATDGAEKKAKAQVKNAPADGGVEKRKKPWLDEPPLGHKVKLVRLASKVSRLFFAGYQVAGTPENPQISFDVIGSTGNLYKTTIKEVPLCDCPDSRYRRTMCKHIIYVRALKAPTELQYQQAFVPSELRSMLENASHSLRIDVPTGMTAEENNGTRKPIEGDCPVCFMEMTADEKIVWCMATCGNNIHGECLKRWAAVSCDSGLRCVYCRSPWKNDKDPATGLDLEDLRSQKKGLGPNRYVNLAEEYGIVSSPKKEAGGGAGGGKKVPGSSQ